MDEVKIKPEFNLTQSKKDIEKVLLNLFDDIYHSKSIESLTINFTNESTHDYYDLNGMIRVSMWINDAGVDIESNSEIFTGLSIRTFTEKKSASHIYNLIRMGFNNITVEVNE